MTELYNEHPVMFKANPIGFIFSIVLILAFGVGLLILLYWYLNTKATKLVVTEDEILYEYGLLSKERIDVNTSMIKTVKVKQTFFNRMFGVGSIEIYTTGDTPEFIVSAMPEPNKIRDIIKTRQHAK